MSYVATDPDTVLASDYTPYNPGITATGFATISNHKIIVKGDSVDSHTNFTPNPDIVHSTQTINNTSGQVFFKVDGKEVILLNDEATCSSSHKITSTSQTFVNVTF